MYTQISKTKKAWIAAGLNPEHYTAACADAMKIHTNSKLEELEKWCDEIDEILAHFEDFMHGEDGKKVTRARKIISEIKSLK